MVAVEVWQGKRTRLLAVEAKEEEVEEEEEEGKKEEEEMSLT